MKAVVLCAGLGTRLGPLTHVIPKPMLPIQSEPLLAYHLRHLAAHGFCEVAVNLHYLPRQITDYFGTGAPWGVHLHYSHEPRLLGTAGALAQLQDWLAGEEDFLVLYGDVLTDQDLHALVADHRQRGAFATLLLHQREASNSVIHMDDSTRRITLFAERPTEEERGLLPGPGRSQSPWVNSGLQVLSHRVLEYIPRGQARDLPKDVYAPLVGVEKIIGFPLSGFRAAIDSPSRYREAEEAVATGRYRPFSPGRSPGEAANR